jgi:hypothetical protein
MILKFGESRVIVKKVADNLQLETMTLDPLWKWKDDKKLEAWG